MAYGNHWFHMRKTATQKQIKKWEKRYESGQVEFLVQDRLIDERSPGRRAAYIEWMEQYKKELAS